MTEPSSNLIVAIGDRMGMPNGSIKWIDQQSRFAAGLDLNPLRYVVRLHQPLRSKTLSTASASYRLAGGRPQTFTGQPLTISERETMASSQARDKYYLRSLHQEIGLYDRKLAHLLKYERFPSEKERDAAAVKLNSRREHLVRDARGLVAEGIEYQLFELPRSLCTSEQLRALDAIPPAAKPAPAQKPDRGERPANSTPSAPVLDFRLEVEAYLERRRRA